ncbi:DUF421 domain-containing protein [Corynebacterium lizhenjunii]|uniref:DUF421 domain-containing protein n=1 Tax=Corynebacterium lizhenjunii TaxID=2709394 RepID=UPI001F43C290|nr:YetF domain-containing protein [Corynebacterium lizhenjunii]
MDWIEQLVRQLHYQLGIETHRIPVVVLATCGIYLSFMVLVKLFGTRVLTSMTASDAVIIIMFGAVAGRVIVGNPPTLAAGVIGLTTLMILESTFGTLQRYVGWTRFIDRHPILLLYAGELQHNNLRLAHVSESEVHSAIRRAGLGRRADVQAMVLEPTGQISIIRAGQPVNPRILEDVLGIEQALAQHERRVAEQREAEQREAKHPEAE